MFLNTYTYTEKHQHDTFAWPADFAMTLYEYNDLCNDVKQSNNVYKLVVNALRALLLIDA